LQVPDPEDWTKRRRYENGLVLIGLAGAGKTACLAHQVQQLLEQEDPTRPDRENPNLVFFLRGNGIALRPGDRVSLFEDVTEKLGIAVDPAAASRRKSGKGLSSFRELLEHLHSRWRADRVDNRRLILVLDGLNEAPYPETVIREALELIGVAACFPWCKVVVSMRQEWLSIWTGRMGAGETSRLEDLRPCLYVPEATGLSGQRQQEGPPVMTLEPLGEAQAAKIYGLYQAAADGHRDGKHRQNMPACRCDWKRLPDLTRQLLANPLYLHLFMEAFDEREAQAIRSVPDLFQRYVDRAMNERPGLRACFDEIVSYLVADLDRPGADLNDDDCNRIRGRWDQRYTPDKARRSLNPVEALVHEGMVMKRVREEGGGYRFVFQAVAEYLVYRHLAGARGTREHELDYWIRRATPPVVFAEYSGAFSFLLRDWAAQQRFDQAGCLTEKSADWLRDVLTTFLVEQARIDYVPGSGSRAVDIACAKLRKKGKAQSGVALYDAGDQLRRTRFAPACVSFFEACVAVRRRLWAADRKNATVGHGLGMALRRLGDLRRVLGQTDSAEDACRESVEIYKQLWILDREDVSVGDQLGSALTILSLLLRAKGQTAAADDACRESVEIYEDLWAKNPQNMTIGHGLGSALVNEGISLLEKKKEEDAANACLRSVRIYEDLRADHSDKVSVGNGMARALNHLGKSLSAMGRQEDAEEAYRRSVKIRKSLVRENPENVSLGDWLGKTLNHLGELLRDGGRTRDAERAFRQSLEISTKLYSANPDHVEVKVGHAASLLNVGRHEEAKDLLSEVLKVVPEHPYANRLKRSVPRAARPSSARSKPRHGRQKPPLNDKTDRNEVLRTIRTVFSRGGPRTREQAIREVAAALGHQRISPRLRDALSRDIRTAVRRGILENAGGQYRLLCRSIDEYTRDHLVETLLAAMGSKWRTRDEAIAAAARHLGFRRAGQKIKAAFKSAINAALRRNLLERDGPKYIRKAR
jgi:tetratricopeptide (TPR) repeat protein